MNVFLWILAGALAVAFLGAGTLKLTRPRAQLAESGMAYVQDFSDTTIKTIGVLEVLGAVALVLPAALGVAEFLVPLAALGFVALMVGAALTHLRRKEYPMIGVNAVLLVIAAVVVWGRFGPHSFS